MKKRVCSLLLSLALCLTLLPVVASATPVNDSAGRVSTHYMVDSNGVLWQWSEKEKNTVLEQPIRVRDGVVAVSDARNTLLWIDGNGTLWGEGTNHFCQLGTTHEYRTIAGNRTELPLKAPVRLMERVQKVYTSGWLTLALDEDGVLWGWGKQDYGQLGPNSSDHTWSFGDGNPVKVMEDVAQFDSTISSVMALKTDGTVWLWGSNDNGVLGRGPLSAGPKHDKNAVQILDHVKQISLNVGTGAAIKEDDTLWIWGSGGAMALMMVETETNWTWGPFQSWEGVKQMASHGDRAMVIKEDGTLWSVECPLMIDMGGGGKGGVPRPERKVNQVAEQVAYVWTARCYLTQDGSLFSWSYNRQKGQVETRLIMAGFGVDNPARNEAKPSDWAATGVEQAKSLGLLTTATSGAFQSKINRLHFTGLVVNLVEKVLGHEMPRETALGRFPDAADESVGKAADAGIVNGAGNGTFGASNPITREQVASILRRAMDYISKETGKQYLTAATDLSAYADGGQVASWHKEDVATMAKNGILQGSGGNLNPQNNITVEESILLVLRLYQLAKG